MAKLIAICGKICSGKTWYANRLREKENAVILSCDELMKALFTADLGAAHDKLAGRARDYLMTKAAELTAIGCTVILDWGFWSRESRKELTNYCRARGILCEWHYIDVDEQTWHKNIEERNRAVLSGECGSDYYADEGLLAKMQALWEVPSENEIDVWYKSERK